MEAAPFEALEGDARALPRPDGSVDAVLFLGPLYHLDREWFTTAWFHRPDELREEVSAAGFTVGRLLAVEGPVALLSDLEQRWADPDERQRLLDAIEALESESSLVGASLHFVAVATA